MCVWVYVRRHIACMHVCMGVCDTLYILYVYVVMRDMHACIVSDVHVCNTLYSRICTCCYVEFVCVRK